MATSRILQPIQGPSRPLRIRKGWSIVLTLTPLCCMDGCANCKHQFVIGLNITTFGQEITLFEHHLAFQLKCKCPAFYVCRIDRPVYLLVLFRVVWLFGMYSWVYTGADLARVKDIPSYLSSG